MSEKKGPNRIKPSDAEIQKFEKILDEREAILEMQRGLTRAMEQVIKRHYDIWIDILQAHGIKKYEKSWVYDRISKEIVEEDC